MCIPPARLSFSASLLSSKGHHVSRYALSKEPTTALVVSLFRSVPSCVDQIFSLLLQEIGKMACQPDLSIEGVARED